MGPKSYTNSDLEKLAYNMNLARELLDRVEAGEEVKGVIAALGSGRPYVKSQVKKVAQLQDKFTQEHVCTELRYKNAISTLKTEFGHIKSVQERLETVYEKCPALKPKGGLSSVM